MYKNLSQGNHCQRFDLSLIKVDSNKIECESLKVVVSLELENLNLQGELNSTWGIHAITLYT